MQLYYKTKVKEKICKCFVVPENGPVLLDMPDIKVLNTLAVNCNTLDMLKNCVYWSDLNIPGSVDSATED